jgi:hypothetical protein
MKKHLIIILLQFILLLIFNNVWSQTGWNFDYTYDASGNRIKRVATLVMMHLANDTTNADSIQHQTQLVNHNPIASNINSNYDNNPNATNQTGTKNNTTSKTGDLTFEDVIAYPNPTFGLLNVDIKNSLDLANAKLMLYTETGALLIQKEISDFNVKVDLRGYATGVYYLKLLFNGNSKTFKIIKEN